MGSFELMNCYCYSGSGGRVLRLISGFRHSAATPGEDYRYFHGGGESGGPEKCAGFRLQTTAGRSRKQHSRTCDLPAVGLALRSVRQVS